MHRLPAARPRSVHVAHRLRGGGRVAYGGDGLFAVEVKRSRRIRRADLNGLTQFRADYPTARCMLLFGGDRPEHRDGVELLPAAEALADPAALLKRST